jgi:hypothetical protein
MVASCSPTGNRRIPVRSPAAAAPSASCTGEAPPLWSAVCSQTSVVGRHPGAKMTRGGGRLTSRAPTEARSASASQGRQEPGRRPACDAMNGDGDSEGDRRGAVNRADLLRQSRPPTRRRPRTRWSASWITRFKAPRRRDPLSRRPQRRALRSSWSFAVMRRRGSPTWPPKRRCSCTSGCAMAMGGWNPDAKIWNLILML